MSDETIKRNINGCPKSINGCPNILLENDKEINFSDSFLYFP